MKTLVGHFGKYTAAEAGKLAGFQFEYLTTLGLAALTIFFGRSLVSKSKTLQKYVTPAPVVSGLIFSLAIPGTKNAGIMEFTSDAKIMKDLYQNLFFLCVGYSFSAEMLKNAGSELYIMTALAACLLITLQNTFGVALAHAIGMNPLLALQCSSVSISGGVGTASAFGPIFEKMGAVDTTTIGVATGTLGNTVGSLIGGPVTVYLTTSRDLKSDPDNEPEAQRTGGKPVLDSTRIVYAFVTCLLLTAPSMSTHILLDSVSMIEMLKFIGCLFASAIGRNVMEALGADMRVPGTGTIERMFLELYLTLALMTTDITKLAPIAGQMGIILAVQVIMMTIFVIFISFDLFDKDCGTAIMAVSNCGWGYDPGPNAIVNERAVMGQYGYYDVAWVFYPPFAVIVDDIHNPIYLSLTGSSFGK